eukprot:CAMPEP_0203763244 /NCGR_PEP_ID=MMETSP0098-20131031/15907_1 /ASSEMBLY_ACC=CAM_ASM_000208 /TAXON_ID=96639 /ORGANISM=" , Strain NY0313808BC1" /LENGTH=65 /DNA_ID=CAMNT_0050657881 /DNA_START=151 /DNA_END=348 /DNA_ORIENTATION=+
MLRRKPTRIELKQDDIAEFEQIRQQQAAQGGDGSKEQQADQSKKNRYDYVRTGLSTEQRIRGAGN